MNSASIKYFLLLVFIFPIPLLSQTVETDISDTLLVRQGTNKIEGEVSYYPQHWEKGKWIFYFDKARTKKAVEYEIFEVDEFRAMHNCTEWFQNGKVKSYRRWNTTLDTLCIQDFYKNERLKYKGIFTKEKGRYSEEKYFDNGQLEFRMPPVDGKRYPTVYYFPSGAKHYEVDRRNGLDVGKGTVYYQSGKIQEEGEYLDPVNVKEPDMYHGFEGWPRRIGVWKEYDEKGELIKQWQYDEYGNLLENK
jgi:antitoxin component YwqK of YwqJK toxin-antitoxin module